MFLQVCSPLCEPPHGSEPALTRGSGPVMARGLRRGYAGRAAHGPLEEGAA